MNVRIIRNQQIPDLNKVEKCHRSPNLGPSILFFSGGNALKQVSKYLIHYTHNSIHLITPFDSGGSSAVLRKAFNMIAVGDIRNRLMALADQLISGNPEVYNLFAYRFPTDADKQVLILTLNQMIAGEEELISHIKGPMQSLICNHLRFFYNAMPPDFDLRGANIGNLILVGGYLNNNCDIEPALFLFERLVEVRGIVKPIVKANLHLISHLQDGEIIVGQHNLTGKTCKSISSPVDKIFLSKSITDIEPETVEIENNIKNLISKADLIVYPMGSFFSSLLVNLLPVGVSQAIAKQDCLKVFIPNTYTDPEQYNLSFRDIISKLLYTLNPDCEFCNSQLLSFIIVDTKNVQYPYEIDLHYVQSLGIGVVDTILVTQTSHPGIDPESLINVILSLAN